MEKSKLGIRLWVYAALAFVLAALGQTLLCGLLCGLAVVAEKNRWLNRQMIQAFALILASAAISTVLGLLNPINSIPFVGLVFSKIVSTVNSLIDLLVIVLAVVGILSVARGKDAGIPVLSGMAEKLCEPEEAPAAPVTPAAAAPAADAAAPAAPTDPQQ